jgi:H+/Cl- antiporter ClcA
MSRKDISYEPMPPRVFAVILLVVSLVAIGVAVLFAFLTDVIDQYLHLDPKIHRLATSGPLSFAIAVTATLAFFYIIYAFLYKSYRS